MKKLENAEATLLMVASLVTMSVPMITALLSGYLLNIGHSVWGVVLCVLGVGVCYITVFVVWGCGYYSGMNEKEKEEME